MWIMDVEHPDSIKLETIPSTNSPPPPIQPHIFIFKGLKKAV